jgi:hypothetical protein
MLWSIKLKAAAWPVYFTAVTNSEVSKLVLPAPGLLGSK